MEVRLPFSTHPMVTQAKDGTFKPKQLYLVTKFPTLEPIEPTCLTQALKHVELKTAMSEVLNVVLANGTWILVLKQDKFNVIGNKCVYRIKRHTNDTNACYKARLVAKRVSLALKF